MPAPCEERFAIIRTGNPKSRFSATQEHGSEDSSMQFRRHPWHDDPTLRHEELEEDDEDFDEDDDGFDADADDEDKDEDDDEDLEEDDLEDDDLDDEDDDEDED